MTNITNEYMQQMLTTVKQYCVCLLKKGPKWDQPDAEQIQWEHVRRNFHLRAEGIMSIVLPVMDDSDIAGIGIFNTDDPQEVKKIMDEDPGVKSGRFVYEIHACLSFPGDKLP